MIFLEFIKKKKYLNNLIFRAKNYFQFLLKITIFGAKNQIIQVFFSLEILKKS